MSDLSFEQMLEESFKTIHNGEVVEGTVIDVKPDEIILNIGYKADGIITRSEYTNDNSLDLTTVVSVGDTMEAKVLKVNDGEGQVLLTYKRLAAEKGSKRLEEAFQNQEVLKGTVTQVLDGGISVMIDETRIFIPASLVSDVYEKDFNNRLKTLGITASQCAVLDYLFHSREEEVNQKDIEKALSLQNPTVTGLLKRLDEKGIYYPCQATRISGARIST